MSFLSNFFEIQSLAIEYEKKMEELEKKNPPASEQEGCTSCCRSGICCWRRPGALEESDVQPIADHLGLTPKELFAQFLVVDEIRGQLKLLPRRKTQEGGRKLGWRETYAIDSPCVFLGENNECTIHDVKPSECREFKCWESQEEKDVVAVIKEQFLLDLGWSGYDPDDYDDYYDYYDYEEEEDQ